ncbi:MAG: Fic family protein [Bacteroidota bacterium]
MNLKKKLHDIELNQELISSHGKLNVEKLKKINYRLRLEWNYYSNKMEGGTLTLAETRSVMIGNIDVRGKSLKDIIEMDGHDQVVKEILYIGTGDKRVSEKRIKQIHSAIMFEYVPELKSQIGKWKTHPNKLINHKQETVFFTLPAEVPDEMHQLINRTNAELDKIRDQRKDQLHPLVIASSFHKDFVSIHPFYDGNGRTARILTNLILTSLGYPVIVINEENKQGYYKHLGDVQSYGGDPDLFYEYMADRLIETQQLMLQVLTEDDSDPFSLENLVKEPSVAYNNMKRTRIKELFRLFEKTITDRQLQFPVSEAQQQGILDAVMQELES